MQNRAGRSGALLRAAAEAAYNIGETNAALSDLKAALRSRHTMLRPPGGNLPGEAALIATRPPLRLLRRIRTW